MWYGGIGGRASRCPTCNGSGRVSTKSGPLLRGVPSCQGTGCLALILLVGCFYFFYKPGRHDLTAVSSPQDYALHLMENSLALRSPPGGTIDPTTNARDAYAIIVQMTGEEDLVRAANALQSARHDANGHLEEPIIVDSGFVISHRDARDPLFAFTTIVTSYDDRGYAAGCYLGNYVPLYGDLWRKAQKDYSAAAQQYGEKTVLEAARKIRAAPKMEDGTLTDLSGKERLRPGAWLRRLLTVPGAQLPRDVKPAVLLASEPDSLRAYVGKMATVAGTVSSLFHEKDGVYFIHFRDSPKVVCYVYPAERDLFAMLEANFSVRVGTPIEVFGDIGSIETGYFVRALKLEVK